MYKRQSLIHQPLHLGHDLVGDRGTGLGLEPGDPRRRPLHLLQVRHRVVSGQVRDVDPLQRRQQPRTRRCEDGPLEHYGFPDWPSGQLRSTVSDLGRAIAMLVGQGQLEGRSILGRTAYDLFHATPLFIGTDDGSFSHSGGESGVNTYIEYDTKGDGLIILTNQDLDDDALEAMFDEVEAELRGWSSTEREEQ